MKKINLDEIQVNAKEAAADQLDEVNGGCRVHVRFICNRRELASLDAYAGGKYGYCQCSRRVGEATAPLAVYNQVIRSSNPYYYYGTQSKNPNDNSRLPDAAYYQKYGKWPS